MLSNRLKKITPSVTVGINSKVKDRKSTRLNSSHANISYAVFCLKKNISPLPPTVPGPYRPDHSDGPPRHSPPRLSRLDPPPPPALETDTAYGMPSPRSHARTSSS